MLCVILLGFQLGKTGLIDPDEPFYALTAKEMLAQHELFTPVMFGKPQFEKPILFYWVIYGFFRTLGVSEFSARLGPCLAGVATVLITYFWAQVLFRRKQVAFISAVILAVSAQFVIMSRIVLTDIFLCLFVTAALFCFSLGERNQKRRMLCWNLVFVFSALGFLTKGPLGFLIPFAGILSYAYWGGQRRIFGEIPWLSGCILFALIGFPWYALMTWKYGVDFLRQFFIHENLRRFFVAEHSGSDKTIFYPLVLFLGFFPWSGFLIPALIHAGRKAAQSLQGRTQKQYLFLWVSFIVPFIFFVAAKSKLMSYIFPVYPIVAILIGCWMFRLYRAVRRGIGPKPTLIGVKALTWGVFPVALVAGTFWFTGKNGVSAYTALIFISLTVVPLCWVSFYLFCQKKYGWAFGGMVLSMLFLSTLSFGWLLPQIETVISSKKWAEKYKKFSKQSSAYLLASKMFVRGFSFYTGNPDISVFSGKFDGDFYTAPPIQIVSDARGLSLMATAGVPIYLLLRKKEWNFLKTIVDGRYSLFILEDTPQQMWVRLEHV